MNKIDSIINSLEKNNNITSKDLDVLKTINEDELEYLLTLKNENENKDYLIKAYFTVYDENTVNKLYLLNPVIIEENFSRVWVENVLSESLYNIIHAYIPTKLFSTQLIYYVRRGIEKEYSENIKIDFENQMISLIETLSYEKEYILSKIYLLNKKNTNEKVLKSFKDDVNTLKDLNLTLKIVKESSNIVENYKNNKFYNFENIKDLDVSYFIEKIFSINFLKNLKNNTTKLDNFNNVENSDNTNNNNENNISIDSALKIESHSENESKDRDEIKTKKYNKKNKLNQINIKTLKKRGNFKLIFFSLLIALVAIIVSIKMIKTEIEKDSKIINETTFEESKIPVKVKEKNDKK